MYGFVPSEPTPSDVIELEGAFTPDDLARAPGDASMRAEKEALLDSCRYRPPRTFELSNRRIDPAIICALRLTLLTAHDLEQRCEGNWNRPLAHAPVSAGCAGSPRASPSHASARGVRLKRHPRAAAARSAGLTSPIQMRGPRDRSATHARGTRRKTGDTRNARGAKPSTAIQMKHARQA